MRLLALLVVATVPGIALAESHVDEGSFGFVLAPRGATTWAWDFDFDGIYDDCPDADGCQFDATDLDGPSEVSVAIVVDGVEGRDAVTIDNVRPDIQSDAPGEARVGIAYSYEPLVMDPAGDRDPPELQLVDGVFPEGMSVVGAQVVWTPTAAQLGRHAVALVVHDGDGGVDTQDWEIEVAQNAAPWMPAPEYPPFGGCVYPSDASLMVSNIYDPDGDPLVVFFEIDVDPSFGSIDLQQSGAVPPDDDSVEWSPPNRLSDSTTYFWRVWASDGSLSSEVASSQFLTCSEYYDDVPYYDDDSGGGDYYGGDDVVMEDGSGRGGCSCWPEPPADDTSAGMDAGIGALALLFIARPRKR